MHLLLKDSQYINGENSGWKSQNNISSFLQAIDKLKKSISNKEIQLFSLESGKLNDIDDDIIWYLYDTPNKATFFTSHYIGYYTVDGVTIEVKPRFGNGIFNHLLSYAYGIYIPKSDVGSSSNTKSSNLWLITIMWKAILEKAITKSQIPKEYKAYEKNSSKFKGQLQISKHIKNNLIDKSKFYCKYRKLTMDTTINQTVRYIYKLLLRKQKGLSNILKDVAEYDNTLQSFGVQDKEVSLFEIQNIRYSKLNINYKKVMELSLLIIKSESSKNDNKSFQKHGFSYFLDIAELWENYLLKILQKNLPEYDIYSPNYGHREYLLEDNFRQIRPDIIMEKNGKTIAILDAKYKLYNKLGAIAKYGVSRDDLYLMSTYLYHYADSSSKVLGLFISPVEGSEIKSLKHNKSHKIGILGLNIEQFKETSGIQFSNENIHNEEVNFIKKLKEELLK
jgi:5-methylcytosine-specific restriction endonuclease McrBC regulatory subunit McrC